MNDFGIYAIYFYIVVIFFGLIIGTLFLIPKFNPKNQYKDFKNAQKLGFLFSKQALKLYIQALIAFIVGFGGIFAILYFLLHWLDKAGII